MFRAEIAMIWEFYKLINTSTSKTGIQCGWKCYIDGMTESRRRTHGMCNQNRKYKHLTTRFRGHAFKISKQPKINHGVDTTQARTIEYWTVPIGRIGIDTCT